MIRNWKQMLMVLALSVSAGLAQEMRLRVVLKFTVQPGHMADFLAAAKADQEAMQKASYKRAQTWWRSVSSGTDVYMVRYYASYADMAIQEKPDAAVSAARRRVNSFSSSMESWIDEVIPEATIMGDRANLPPYARVLRATIKPEHLDAWGKVMREEIAPAVKKGGLPFYVATQVRYGATANMYTTVQGLKSLAELDGGLPLEKVMGKTDYQRLLGKVLPMTEHMEVLLLQGLPEINYLPQQ